MTTSTMKITSTKNHSNEKLKFLIYGEPGVGKTTLARTIKEPTLLVSAEAGLLSLNDSEIDVIDITQDDDGNMIPKEKRFDRLKQVYKHISTEEVRKKYKWIFLDSLTEINQSLMDTLYLQYPEKKDSRPMYGDNHKLMSGMIKSFRDIPWYNIVFTALASTKTNDDNIEKTGVSLVGQIATDVPAYFDEVLFMATRTNPETGLSERVLLTEKTEKIMAKDRSSKLNKLEKPDLQLIADKIRGVSNG